MRKLIGLTIVATPFLGACGGDGDGGGSASACRDKVEDGGTFTDADIADCKDTEVLAVYECDGGETVYSIDLDSGSWAFLSGTKATKLPENDDSTVTKLRSFCPAA